MSKGPETKDSGDSGRKRRGGIRVPSDNVPRRASSDSDVAAPVPEAVGLAASVSESFGVASGDEESATSGEAASTHDADDMETVESETTQPDNPLMTAKSQGTSASDKAKKDPAPEKNSGKTPPEQSPKPSSVPPVAKSSSVPPVAKSSSSSGSSVAKHSGAPPVVNFKSPPPVAKSPSPPPPVSKPSSPPPVSKPSSAESPEANNPALPTRPKSRAETSPGFVPPGRSAIIRPPGVDASDDDDGDDDESEEGDSVDIDIDDDDDDDSTSNEEIAELDEEIAELDEVPPVAAIPKAPVAPPPPTKPPAPKAVPAPKAPPSRKAEASASTKAEASESTKAEASVSTKAEAPESTKAEAPATPKSSSPKSASAGDESADTSDAAQADRADTTEEERPGGSESEGASDSDKKKPRFQRALTMALNESDLEEVRAQTGQMKAVSPVEVVEPVESGDVVAEDDMEEVSDEGAVHGEPPTPPPKKKRAETAEPPPPPPPSQKAAAPKVQQQKPAPEEGKKRQRKPWFEEIFDEDYLRTLPFLTPQATQFEANFVMESLGLEAGAQILDVGCGYGRHAMELAARGYHLVGLDSSLPLLLRGADEAQRRGLTINFVHGDMRDMTYESQFDGAYCLFSTFGYFDDETNKRTAQNIAKALKPGARLVVEVLNRDYLVADLPSRVWWEGDGCVVLEEVEFNYFSSRIVSNRSVVFDDGRQLEHEISLRSFSLHELGKFLHAVGFRVLEISGSMSTRGRFFGAHSRDIVVVAERRATNGDES